jgi:16S rRNA (adenine1518-N6/adenine1519-N6)-dimethyltransferase
MGRSKRKRLGQNFLVDQQVARRMVSLLEDEPPRVVEIGPGRGALTAPLLERFDRVLALEIDPVLVPPLIERFIGSSLEVSQWDALHDPLEPLMDSEAPWQLASNLPYSVGTAIVRRLMPRHDLFARLVVMLQREVAERLVARPGDREHGLLALERAVHAEARLALHVGPASFRPRPRVHSSVVVIDLREPSVTGSHRDQGLRLAAHALTKPRKTLANALKPLCGKAALGRAGLDPATRPATVSLDGWLRLARVLD